MFNAGDYPAKLQGLFEVSWDFPSVESPEYLRQLSSQLYQQEAQRVAARFDAAVELAEQAFTEELAKLISHLTERLSGTDDGKPKDFRDSAGAVAWLKISERSLWAMANRGEIRAIRFGRSVRYDVADLQEFVDSRKTEVTR